MISAKTTLFVTLGILGIASAALIGYDILVGTDKVPGNTISEVTLGLAKRYPIVPFTVGIILGALAGHLFWPQSTVQVPTP